MPPRSKTKSKPAVVAPVVTAPEVPESIDPDKEIVNGVVIDHSEDAELLKLADAVKDEPTVEVEIIDGKLVDVNTPELSDNDQLKSTEEAPLVDKLVDESTSNVPETHTLVDDTPPSKVDYEYPAIVNLNSMLHSMMKYSIEELGTSFEIIHNFRTERMTDPNDSALAFTTPTPFLELKTGFIEFIKDKSTDEDKRMLQYFFKNSFKRFVSNNQGTIYY